MQTFPREIVPQTIQLEVYPVAQHSSLKERRRSLQTKDSSEHQESPTDVGLIKRAATALVKKIKIAFNRESSQYKDALPVYSLVSQHRNSVFPCK